MTEKGKAFLTHIRQNKELNEQLLNAIAAAGSEDIVNDKLIELAESCGFTLSREDLALERAGQGKLDDDDLDTVAGGFDVVSDDSPRDPCRLCDVHPSVCMQCVNNPHRVSGSSYEPGSISSSNSISTDIDAW